MTLRVIFSILNNLSLRKNINLNIRKFTRANKPLFWQKWTPDAFSYFRPPCLCPSEGHKHGVSILSSINLCGTFCQITRVQNAAQTWHLDRCLIYLSSIPCQFLDFIHGMVLMSFFNGVTVKTENQLSVNSRILETWKKRVGSERLFISVNILISFIKLRTGFAR